MSDLYDALGVDKNATGDEIKKAYRRKAKKAHPDAGGSSEEFNALTTAYDCLSDEKRRDHYDRTGDTGSQSADHEMSEALAAAVGAVNAVVNAIEQRGQRIETFDVVGDAITVLTQQIGEIKTKIKLFTKTGEKLEKTAKRFKVKKGKPNRLESVFLAQAKDQYRQAEQTKRTLKIFEMARDILADHTFDWSPDTVNTAPVNPFGNMGFVQWR